MKTVTKPLLEYLESIYPTGADAATIAMRVDANQDSVRGALVRLTKAGKLERERMGFYKLVKQ